MHRIRIVIVVVLMLFIANMAVAQQGAQTPTQVCESAVPASEPSTRQFAAAEQVLESGVDYRAIFCTEAGAVYIDLLEDLTPITVNSFVFLAQQGYYNNTTFHRVMDQFMAQGGDPTATGTGGPGYNFEDEFIGFLTFDQAGWLAMANAGPGTNGSQFFITTVPTQHLDFRHTIFGQVLEGQENVDAIRLRDPDTDTQPGTALQAVVIVTDPSTITTSHVAPAPATSEQVGAIIDQISAELPSQLSADTEKSGVSTAEEIVSIAPQGLQDSLEAMFSENEFEFRGAIEVDNAGCDLTNAPFMSIGYTLDAYVSSAGAAAAIATAADENGVLYQVALENGFVPLEAETSLPYPIFIGTTQVCDQTATKALTFWQRGRFVITAEATYPTDSQATADVWLGEVVGVRIYEQLFASVLRTTLN
jgi:cyclophilin family peptidyl-prolyl cis-trans isomerase